MGIHVIEHLEPRLLLASTLISAAGASDLIYDSSRDLMYISAQSGLMRYSLATGQLLPTFSASLLRGDITPDKSAVYAIASFAPSNMGAIDRVNLNTGAVSEIDYPLSYPDSGPFDLNIAANGKALFDGDLAGTGSVSFYQLNTSTNVITKRSDYSSVAQTTLISRSGDGGRMFLQPAGFSPGALQVYSSATDSFPVYYNQGGNGYGPAALNHDGSLIAAPFNGASIVDANLKYAHQLQNITGGMVFDPSHPRFFGVDPTTDQVIAYDTNTWQELFRLSIGQDVGVANNQSVGTMAMNDAGTKLFLITSSGVRVIDVPASDLNAASLNLNTSSPQAKQGTSETITLAVKDAAGVPATNYRGTVHFTSSDPAAILPADYTFAAADNGKHVFSYTLSTVGTQTITATDTASSGLSSSWSIFITAPNPVTIPVTSVRQFLFDKTRNQLILTTTLGNVVRYDVATQSYLPVIAAGSSLNGADITPDGKYLYAPRFVDGRVVMA